MKIPSSASDLKPDTKQAIDEIMIIIDDQKFMKSYKDALHIAGVIIATVCGTMDIDDDRR